MERQVRRWTVGLPNSLHTEAIQFVVLSDNAYRRLTCARGLAGRYFEVFLKLTDTLNEDVEVHDRREERLLPVDLD